MAKLLDRFGRRIGIFTALTIEYPVGRAGARFEALISTAVLQGLDTRVLRHFVVQDDHGNRYSAMFDEVTPAPDDWSFTQIRGALVSCR